MTTYEIVSSELKEKSSIDFFSTAIPEIYLPTLRSILDSVFHLFSYQTENKSLPRFPEFVYGWFSSFEINAKTLEISIVSNDLHE